MIDTRIKSLLIIIISQSIALNGSAPKKRPSKMLPFLIAKKQLRATRRNNALLEMLLTETQKSNIIGVERNKIAAEHLKALQEQNSAHRALLKYHDELLKRSAEPSSPLSLAPTPCTARTPMSASFLQLSAAAQQVGQRAMEIFGESAALPLSASTPDLAQLAKDTKPATHRKSATVPLSPIPSPAHAESAACNDATQSAAATAQASTAAPKTAVTIDITPPNE